MAKNYRSKAKLNTNKVSVTLRSFTVTVKAGAVTKYTDTGAPSNAFASIPVAASANEVIAPIISVRKDESASNKFLITSSESGTVLVIVYYFT